MNNLVFEYEYVPSIEELVKIVQGCEGRHTQQAVFSTFHNGLTQVCFGCKKVRSNIRRVKKK